MGQKRSQSVQEDFTFLSVVSFNSVTTKFFPRKVMKKSSKTGNSTERSEMLDPEGNLMMDKVKAARKKSRMPPPTFDKVYFFCATLLLTIPHICHEPTSEARVNFFWPV